MSSENLWIFWLIPVWLALWVGASIVFRLNRGKPIIPKAPKNAIFSEGWASGRSLNTPWGRFGGAQNCLLVAVTPTELIVVPRFPFTLIFLPEIYGLELRVRRAQVHVENPASGLLKSSVTIFADSETTVRMQLKLRDRVGFLAALSSK